MKKRLYTLWWTRAGAQGSINMGEFNTEAAAEAAIPAAEAELISQLCGGDENTSAEEAVAGIKAGRWSVE